MPLEPYFPIFLLNAVGEDQHCIFLNGNHCSVYAHRPRACRMYPFTVDAGRRDVYKRQQMCRKVGISWSKATSKERQFIEEITRFTFEREQAQKAGLPLDTVKPMITVA